MVLEIVSAMPVAQALAKGAGSAAVSAFARSRGADEHAHLLKVVARAIVEEKRGDDYAFRTESGWHVLHATGVATRRAIQGTKDGLDRTRVKAALAQLDLGLLTRQPYSYVQRVSLDELLPALQAGASGAHRDYEPEPGGGPASADASTREADVVGAAVDGVTRLRTASKSRRSWLSRLRSKVTLKRRTTTDGSPPNRQHSTRLADTNASPTSAGVSHATSGELSLKDLRQRFRDPFSQDLGVWLLALVLACRESRHAEARKTLISAGVPVEEWIRLAGASTPLNPAGGDAGGAQGPFPAGVGVAWLMGVLSRILGYVPADRRLSQLAARRQETIHESRHIELIGVQTRRARAVERLVWAAAVVAGASATAAALLVALALGLLDSSM